MRANDQRWFEYYITSRVADSHMHPVLAARAAAYVVEDGLPLKDLRAILDSLDQADRAGKIRHSSGAWFNAVLRKQIHKLGIPERRSRPRRGSMTEKRQPATDRINTPLFCDDRPGFDREERGN